MAYAYTDPTSIDYILQRAYDELRRGESQHYRSTEAQYTHHVKELLGNLERYLETCGVRLPAEVQEGTEISAAAAALSEQENGQTTFSAPPRGHSVGTQRVSKGLHIGGRSASASAVVSSAKCDSDAVNRQEAASSNLTAHLSGSIPSGWGNLATPYEVQRDNGAANSHHATGSGPVAAAASTVHGTPLQSNLAHATSDTSSSPLTAGYQRHPAPDNRSVHTTNSESEASVLYNSQQATRAHATCSFSSPSVAVDVGADGNAESHIASLMYSGDAAGVDSCSVNSGSAPIVAIIDSGYGGGNGARSRGRSENATMRSPPAPPKLQEYCTGEGARGGLYASGDGVSRSGNSHHIGSNVIAAAPGVSDAGAGAARTAAGLDRWGEFGMFVQSITESRQNSNLASFDGVATAEYPLPNGVNSALVATLPTAAQKEETGSTGVSSAPFTVVAPSPGATPKFSLQLPYVLSSGTSMTTPPTPVLVVAAGALVHQQPLNWGGAKAHTASLPLQVAHGAGSSAVRALAAVEVGCGSEIAGLEGDQRPSPLSHIVSSPIPLAPVPRQCCVDEAVVGVPQVECILSPRQHSRPGRPARQTGVVVPMQCTAPVLLAGRRLRPGGGDGMDSLSYCQRAQPCFVPPHTRTSTGEVAATAPTVSAMSAEKEQLMCRLRGVLKRSVYVPSSVQSSAVPSPVAEERQSSFFKAPAWGVKGKQDGPVEVGSNKAPAPTSVPSPQLLLQSQRMPSDTTPLRSTTRTNGTSDESANVHCSVDPPEHKNGDSRRDATGGVAWNRSWDFLRRATVAASGCPYTSSSNDISSEPTTSHGVLCSTVRPKDPSGDGNGGTKGLPRNVHQSEDLRAQRYVGSSDKDAIMTTETSPGVLGAGGEWDRGSYPTASFTCGRAYIEETIAPSLIADVQHQPQRIDAERRSFSTGLASSHAEKQELIHRLRMVLSRSDECALNGR